MELLRCFSVVFLEAFFSAVRFDSICLTVGLLVFFQVAAPTHAFALDHVENMFFYPKSIAITLLLAPIPFGIRIVCTVLNPG